jgi:XTP/dITP diphosphohydrolase
MRLSNKVLLATTNRHKFEEFKTLLSAYDDPELDLVPAEELVKNPERLGLVERHDTYLENAVAKARLANGCAHYPTLADDSGLEVEGLDGKPGVRSHRFATPKAGMTQDEANIQFLLSELGNKSHHARFVCTLSLVIEGIMIHATGSLEGTIIDKPRGSNGFGYDPIFVPHGSDKTFAEMTDSEKNRISHRKKALDQLMAQVKSLGIQFVKA